MKTGIMVCEAMTKQPVYIGPDATLAECASLMKEKRIGSLLVKEEDILVGILTEEDIVRKAVARQKAPGMLTARDVMIEGCITISAEKDIVDAVALMSEFHIKHLPVLANKKLVGLLTMKDALLLGPQIFEILFEKLSVGHAKQAPVNKTAPEEGLCQGCGEYADELTETGGQMLCLACLQ